MNERTLRKLESLVTFEDRSQMLHYRLLHDPKVTLCDDQSLPVIREICEDDQRRFEDAGRMLDRLNAVMRAAADGAPDRWVNEQLSVKGYDTGQDWRDALPWWKRLRAKPA